MTKPTTPFEMPAHMRVMTEQAMDHMRDVMNKYLQFVQQGMSAWPGGRTELSKKAMTYAEQNVANTFDLAKKLMVAKSLEDVVRLQTEFAQAQAQALTDQAKDLAESATRAAAETAKNPLGGEPQ